MSRVTIPPNSSYHRWVGVFSRLEVVLTVKGYVEDKTFKFLRWILSHSKEMVIDYPYAIEHKIRVIGYDDCKWYIDPPIEDIN